MPSLREDRRHHGHEGSWIPTTEDGSGSFTPRECLTDLLVGCKDPREGGEMRRTAIR